MSIISKYRIGLVTCIATEFALAGLLWLFGRAWVLAHPNVANWVASHSSWIEVILSTLLASCAAAVFIIGVTTKRS